MILIRIAILFYSAKCNNVKYNFIYAIHMYFYIIFIFLYKNGILYNCFVI